MIYIKKESLTNFKFWGGAVDRAKLLTYSELEKLDEILPNVFFETPTDTNINDLFWFEFDSVCRYIDCTEDEVLARENEEA